MLNLQLNYNYGYKWYSSNKVYVKGYLFDKNNNLLEKDSLINYFTNINNEEEFIQKLINTNGIFSVIIQMKDLILFAVDKTRTFPLFYIENNNKLYVSDDTYNLKNLNNVQIDNISIDEYISTGYVTGRDTLLKNIYQVQSGEYISYKKNNLNRNFYFDYITKEIINKDFNTLKNNFLNVLDNTIKRLIKFADGKQIVIPLSGGYDSRLIVALLKKHNYQNVFCFTYGNKDSFEVNISKKVAKELGYDWYFVEYNKKTIPYNYPNSENFQDYYKFASNHVSIFLTQDYFAVKYLYENNLIKNNSVFAPGHTEIFFGDNQLVKKDVIVKSIIERYYRLSKRKEFYNKLNYLNEVNVPKKLYYSVYNNFNLKEKQSKFTVNANRIYEFFGYKHSIPLGDSEIIEFFRVLPPAYKLNFKFYNKVILEEIFDNMNIGFRKQKERTWKRNIKNIIKKNLPIFLKRKLIHTQYNDFNNFYLMHTPIQLEVNNKYSIVELNLLLAEWYCLKVKNESNN